MTILLILSAIFLGACEGLFQLFWIRQYFRHGIRLRATTVAVTSIPMAAAEVRQNKFLRNFEIKSVSSDEFMVRQGKFGFSRSIFFHGFVKSDAPSGRVTVKVFVDLDLIFFSMACGSWLASNQWMGMACGACIAWGSARYFVDEGLLSSIVNRAHGELQIERDLGKQQSHQGAESESTSRVDTD